MMTRGRLGLRCKLSVAFLLIAVIPLLIVASVASLKGAQLSVRTEELRRDNDAVMFSLRSYVKRHSTLRSELVSWIEEHVPAEQRPELLESLRDVKKTFTTEQEELQNVLTQYQETYRKHLSEFEVFAEQRQIFLLVLILLVVSVAIGAAFILGKYLTEPIIRLTDIAHKISQGEIDHHIHIRANDELGRLSRAFQAMTLYMQDMTRQAKNIARGSIQDVSPPKSDQDLLGNAFYLMGQYLKNIVAMTHHIAQGELNYTVALKSADDELGTALQRMTTHLTDTIQRIKEEVHAISTTSKIAAERSEEDLIMVEDVLSSAEETSSSMMQMEASVEEVSENMSALSLSVENSVTSIEEMNMSIKQIAENGTGLAQAARETFGVVQHISETISRLVATAAEAEESSQEASVSAKAGQASVREIIEGMEVIQRAVATASETIKALGNRSQEIGSITDVISDIADQTSLLALNASIIAAQAGEHGRGFAVVAQEVKDLANRSLSAAREIGELIKGVQAEADKAVSSMNEGSQAVENGVILANRGGDALDTISASVQKSLNAIAENTRTTEEQATLSEQVRTYMENVLGMVNEIARATKEQQKGSAQVTEAVEQMRDLAEQVKRATTEQRKGTGHVLEAMDSVTLRVQESSNRAREIAQFSAELAEGTALLIELLQQFALDDHAAAARTTPSTELVPVESLTLETIEE